MANSALSSAGSNPVNLSSLILPATTNVVRASKPKWLKKTTVATVTKQPNEDIVDIEEEDLRSRTVTSLKQRAPRKPKTSSKKTSVGKTSSKKKAIKKPIKKPAKKNNKKKNKRK